MASLKPEIIGITQLYRAVDKLTAEMEQAVEDETINSLNRIADDARANCPVSDEEKKAGEVHLRDTIAVELKGKKMSGRVTAGGKGARHPAFVEFGTSPHQITTGKRTLSDGNAAFGKSISHPGSTANPFLFPAAEREKPRYEANVTAAIDRVARKGGSP